MWSWTLNWGEVRHDLVVGSCPMTTKDLDRLHRETGAGAFLSVQTDACRAAFAIDHHALLQHGRQTGLVMASAPMRDFDPPDQRRRLAGAVRALHGLLADGHRVYVHCTAGINRAPLTVLAYLTLVEHLSTDDAMAFILGGRPQAEPYWEAYHGCREDLVAALTDDIRRRARQLFRRCPHVDRKEAWLRAERDAIRASLTPPAASNQPRG